VNASEAFTLSVLAASCATPEGTTILQSANITSSTRDPNLAPNNASSATALVSNPPPVVSLIGEPSMTLECGMSFSDPGATAVDACDGPVAVTSSGTVDVNQVGTYAVRYDASDSAGGLASRVRAVNVVDTTAPTVVLKSPSLLTCGQPLHQYKSFSVADFVASVADCDANATVVIESVTSDEPEDAPGGEDGKTLNDIVISGDCQSVQLRSERNASGNGRVYTVTLRIRDASGNSTVESVRVNVPKNTGDGAHGTAVDDGPRYSVAGNCQ
jgi:hypothetical protein